MSHTVGDRWWMMATRNGWQLNDVVSVLQQLVSAAMYWHCVSSDWIRIWPTTIVLIHYNAPKTQLGWHNLPHLRHVTVDRLQTRSCTIAKMAAQCALYTWVPWKFSGLRDYANGYYSQHFSWAFVPIDPVNVAAKFEVRSFTRSWDNRGYPKNLGSPWIRPCSIFSRIFNGHLFGLAL